MLLRNIKDFVTFMDINNQPVNVKTKIKSLVGFPLTLSLLFLAPNALSSQTTEQSSNSAADTPQKTVEITSPKDNTEHIDTDFEPAITSDDIAAIYREKPTNSRFENLTPTFDLTNSAYDISLFSAKNGEDGDRLWSQTTSIFGYGFGVIGLIALLPEDVSNWDKEQGIFSKWSDNVKDGPVWDRDTGALNFIGHPYFGGVYYQVARKSGYRQWDAFVYSALMSTFYWEYGIEAFAETPSIQDLVITPVLGWAYGEWAFNTEMDIRKDGGTVLGSSMLGSTALFFLDPVDSMSVGINNLFNTEVIKAGTGYIDVKEVPYGGDGKTDTQVSFNMTLQLGDGGTYSPVANKSAKRAHDPVDYGIIGLSYGVGQVSLDELWQVEDGSTNEFSLGLYFSPSFSSRLTYSKAKLTPVGSVNEVNYENYSLDSQYYFNTDSNFRPYITAGIGETLWEKELESKRFQVNSGLGAHYQITKKISVQADWRYYHSTNANTSDNNGSLRIIYQLGSGAR